MATGHLLRSGWLLCVAVLTGGLLWLVIWCGSSYPRALGSTCYVLLRAGVQAGVEITHRGLMMKEGEHFTVKFRPVDAGTASLVLETAERVYAPINADLEFSFSRKIPVIIYPNGKELARSFGWLADGGTLGAYWLGTIRVLSPRAWVAGDEKHQAEVFWSTGPMAHEYTHFVVDYLTRGNCPRWLTEGLAQWEERKLTGFVLTSPQREWVKEPFTLLQLEERFEDEGEQVRAYWQALAAVDFLETKYGRKQVNELLRYLGQGYSWDRAFCCALGVNLEELNNAYIEWLQEYLP